jgi:hypothetical protein
MGSRSRTSTQELRERKWQVERSREGCANLQLMRRKAWIAMALVLLVIVLLVVAVLRSVAELREIYEEDDDEVGMANQRTEGAKIEKWQVGGAAESPLPIRLAAFSRPALSGILAV